MRKETIQWLIPVLLAMGAAAALWFWWAQTERPEAVGDREPVQPAETVDTSPEQPEEPAYPVEAPETAAQSAELRPLPPLDESDRYFKLEVTDLFGETIDAILADDHVIERIVATVDNLSREQIAERIKPVEGVGGQFIVEETDDGEEYILDPQNYGRYDEVVALVENTDIEQADELYRRFYPLFQKAYEDLGYPQGYFNDRLVEVIDHLLATPDVEEPIRLVRPHVLYEYADPELESLSPGQKLLLRIGGEHRATVKEKLREFRARISES
jgi:hypothetical protein